MSQAEPPPQDPKLPKDKYTSLLNTLSLSISKSHSSILSSISHHRKAPTTKSSLSSTSRHQPPPQSNTDSDLSYIPPPNQGIGFSSSKPLPTAQQLATDDLKKKLLGKNALRQKEEAKRKKEESESEDEVGRGGLGRKTKRGRVAEPEPAGRRKKKVRVEEPKPVSTGEEKGISAAAVEGKEESVEGDVQTEDVLGNDEKEEEVTPPTINGKEKVDGEDGEKKRKRKKKNEKKKRKASRTEGGGDGDGAAVEGDEEED
ncbi:hypothetical protein QC763_0055620 [Podospora pseudopauciseta]|uniref:Uncharacterized protein n=2 Tax=Podospora TaxID=5144 RepID=A0ABR0HGR7_9PEZI|nr:hypothetical protein QC763_0055620 [Podospora pseudopauciseta]KAK4678448.1 hypothetical protein QC764_0055350 [Podospora pseudoanserina]